MYSMNIEYNVFNYNFMTLKSWNHSPPFGQ